MPKIVSRLFPIVALFGFTPEASAQLVQNLLVGNAKAISLGHAVTADPPGIDAIHYNPAGLTRIRGRQVNFKLVTGNADIGAKFRSNPAYDELLQTYNLTDPIANTESKVESLAFYMPGSGVTEVPVLLAPLGGVAYSPPGSDYVIGDAVYAPWVLGYIRDEDDPGRYYGTEAGVTRLTFLSPSIAWRVNDKFSVGATLGLSYFALGGEMEFRAPNYYLGVLNGIQADNCSGQDFGFGTEFINQLGVRLLTKPWPICRGFCLIAL